MIDKKDVDKIALLARLKLSEDEKELFTGQLKDIVGYIDFLSELDTPEASEEENSVSGLSFREDIPEESDKIKDILSIAPDAESCCFRVKKVLE